MSYIPSFEASKALPMDYIAKELQDFAATGQDLSGRRFSRSPPRVSSVPSTAYDESQPPSPGEQLRDKEGKELERSTADAQFVTQIEDEEGRIRAARDKNLLQHPDSFDLEEAAEANVKYRWIQQGIWDKRWDGQPYKRWKHELKIPQPLARLSKIVKKNMLETKQRRKHADLEEEYHEIVRCAVDYQSQQSSRPCYQFLYQVCQQREWIKMGLSEQDQDRDQETDLDTRAYEVVKSRWVRDDIWDDDWTFVPGTSWRHERPRKAPDPHGTYRWDNDYKAANIERAERPPRWYFMAPTAPLTRINWPPIWPGSPEAASNPSSPSTSEPTSKVTPPAQDRTDTLRTYQSTRNSTAKAERSPKRQKRNEPQTNYGAHTTTPNPASTHPEEEAFQEQKAKASQPIVAEVKPVKKQASTNKEKHRPPTPATIQKETLDDAAAPRPRRAAALQATNKIAKTYDPSLFFRTASM